MAYETGVFGGSDDMSTIHAKIKTFAAAQGWAAAGSYPNMTLEKGAIHAGLEFFTVNVDDHNKTGGNLPDGRINTWLADSTSDIASFTYPNSMRVYPSLTNDWAGPYSKYWLFSGGDGDPDYLALVVQKANGNFCCWMLGTLDQKGVGYDGGAYATGVFWNWWFFTGSRPDNNAIGSQVGSDAFSILHGFPGDVNMKYNLRLGDTIATQINPTSHMPFTGDASGLGGVPFNLRKQFMLQRNGKPINMESYGVFGTIWLGHIYWLGPNPVNGISPMFEVFEGIWNNFNGSNHFIYLGTYPGYRAISMLGRVEAEEVSFGDDDYLVFPIKRFQPFIPEPFASGTVTSGPYGHAFKKNV